MSNPLFNMLGGNNNLNGMIQQFNQFKSMFKGNPKAQVEQMLSSGAISQEQFNQIAQQATQLRKMLK